MLPSRSCLPTTTQSSLACTAMRTSPSAGCRQGRVEGRVGILTSAPHPLHSVPAGACALLAGHAGRMRTAGTAPLIAMPSCLLPLPSCLALQVQDAVQLIVDTAPRSGGGNGGQTREEVVDAMCEDLLAKVSTANCSADCWRGDLLAQGGPARADAPWSLHHCCRRGLWQSSSGALLHSPACSDHTHSPSRRCRPSLKARPPRSF